MEEMSKAFLESMSALKVHEEWGNEGGSASPLRR